MPDFFEIDFLDVESEKSGDAIAIRYEIAGARFIHVVDGGFQATGDSLVQHVRKYYDGPRRIDHVVVTHPDGDHAGGVRSVLDAFEIGALWMLRPWRYAAELLPRFARFSSVGGLEARLKEIYPNIATLEEMATRKGIPILEPFQGATVGAFKVLAPSRSRYLDLIVQSDRTPESAADAVATPIQRMGSALGAAISKVAQLVASAWGQEVFSPNETSAENEMSVVQFAQLRGKRILLTADTGRSGLTEAADYVERLGLALPGVDRFQVPHHGSRRNVSTDVLDRWLGPRHAAHSGSDGDRFTAIISSAKKDEHHPRKSVVRAMIHRGGKVVTTEGQCLRTQADAPLRDGWVAAKAAAYPGEQESA